LGAAGGGAEKLGAILVSGLTIQSGCAAPTEEICLPDDEQGGHII